MALYEVNPDSMHGSGDYFKGRAGETLGRCALVYKAANGAWYLADADAAATMPVIGITLERANTGQIVRILDDGFVGRRTWTWTTGGAIYASTVAGELTQVAPAGPGDVIQIVAMATSPRSIKFSSDFGSGAGGAGGGLGDYTYLILRDGVNYDVYDRLGNNVSTSIDADTSINWALTNGGANAVVYLNEDSIFAINDPITFTANGQTLRGGGRGSFIDGDALATGEHAIVLVGFDDCRIVNLSIQTQDGGGKTCYCIYVNDGADRFLIEDVWIVDSDSSGIRVAGTDTYDGTIRGCRILDTDLYGIEVDMDGGSYAYDLIITQNIIGAVDNDGMTLNDMVRGQISFNDVVGAQGDGMSFALCEEVLISGNTVANCLNHGFRLGTDRCYIRNNVVYGNDSGDTATFDGINLTAVANDNFVEANICYNNHRYGIFVDFDRNVINGNSCIENDRHGIYLSGDDCDVTNNYCYHNGVDANATYDGIYLDAGADRAKIIGNRCYSDGVRQRNGIRVDVGADDGLIEGNYCNYNAGSGIYLVATITDASIVGNYLFENGIYGVNIGANTVLRTLVKENIFNNNTTGAINDAGTDTRLPFIFAEVTDPNAVLGRHPVKEMPDATDTHVYSQIMFPLEFQELVTSHVIVVAAASGDMVWTVDTDFGKLCATEDYNTHSDSGGGTDTLVINDFECIDISAAFTAIAAGDLAGIDFMRNGDDVADTIGDSVYYLGVRVRYV